MTPIYVLLAGISLILGYLCFFANNAFRSLIENFYQRNIAHKKNALLNGLFEGLLNISKGDMGNVLYKGVGIVLGFVALWALGKIFKIT